MQNIQNNENKILLVQFVWYLGTDQKYCSILIKNNALTFIFALIFQK